MKTLRTVVMAAAAMLALSIAATSAFAIEAGTSLLGIHVGGGEAEWVQDAGTAGYITSESKLPTIRAGLEYWHVMANDKAITLSGGLGYFSETDKPGTAAAPASPDLKSTVTSFHVRLGMDDMYKVTDNVILYMGPGVQYGSGKFKFEAGTFSDEAPTVTTWSLDGRFGGMCKKGNVGMGGSIGHSFGISSATKDGAKANWTSGGFYGEGSLVFFFGGS